MFLKLSLKDEFRKEEELVFIKFYFVFAKRPVVVIFVYFLFFLLGDIDIILFDFLAVEWRKLSFSILFYFYILSFLEYDLDYLELLKEFCWLEL